MTVFCVPVPVTVRSPLAAVTVVMETAATAAEEIVSSK